MNVDETWTSICYSRPHDIKTLKKTPAKIDKSLKNPYKIKVSI